ncbi:MAG: hypothetical protein IPK80_26090 [Nannocystis sp.]|nr:hypothetical protein [Nannocystis sp.]
MLRFLAVVAAGVVALLSACVVREEPVATDTLTSTSTTAPTTTTSGETALAGCDEPWEHSGDLIITQASSPDELRCLTVVHGSLRIEGDIPEDVLAGLADLRRVTGTLFIADNGVLGDLDAFARLEEVDILILRRATALTDLSGLSGLRAARVVELCELGLTALPSFAPDFAGIARLDLCDNPALTDLSAASSWGVDPAADSLSFFFTSNDALSSLAGLSGLVEELGDRPLVAVVWNHPELTSLAGLSATNLDLLTVVSAPKLTDLEGLAVATDGGNITLDQIPLLTSLKGLHNMTSIGSLTLGGCIIDGFGGLDGITSLAGLDSVTRIDTLIVVNNDALVSLDGAPALHMMDELRAGANPALSQAAYDAFIAQFASPPFGCFGTWSECNCPTVD